jgi:hypothetical protein
MGELDSGGSGDSKDQVTVGLHAREKKNDCNRDNACPNFNKKESILDIFCACVGRNMPEIVFGVGVAIFFLIVCFFGFS